MHDRKQAGVPHAQIEGRGQHDRDGRRSDEEEEEVVDLKQVLEQRQDRQGHHRDGPQNVERATRTEGRVGGGQKPIRPSGKTRHQCATARATTPLGRSRRTRPSTAYAITSAQPGEIRTAATAVTRPSRKPPTSAPRLLPMPPTITATKPEIV